MCIKKKNGNATKPQQQQLPERAISTFFICKAVILGEGHSKVKATFKLLNMR